MFACFLIKWKWKKKMIIIIIINKMKCEPCSKALVSNHIV